MLDMIPFANSLDYVGSAMDPNRLCQTIWSHSWKLFFKKVNFEKIRRRQKYLACNELKYHHTEAKLTCNWIDSDIWEQLLKVLEAKFINKINTDT